MRTFTLTGSHFSLGHRLARKRRQHAKRLDARPLPPIAAGTRWSTEDEVVPLVKSRRVVRKRPDVHVGYREFTIGSGGVRKKTTPLSRSRVRAEPPLRSHGSSSSSWANPHKRKMKEPPEQRLREKKIHRLAETRMVADLKRSAEAAGLPRTRETVLKRVRAKKVAEDWAKTPPKAFADVVGALAQPSNAELPAQRLLDQVKRKQRKDSDELKQAVRAALREIKA